MPILAESAEVVLRGDGWTLPRTRGVPVKQADQDEEAWLACRRAGIGASEMASILGVPGAYHSQFSLWWAKHEQWTSERNFNMKVGSRLEQPIATLFADERPDLFVARPAHRLWQHPEIDWMLASPDFVACNSDGECFPVECKSDEGPSWGKPSQPDTLNIPAKHLVQTRVQCEVLGAPYGFLVRLSGKRLSIYTVHRADAVEVGAWIMHGNAFMASLALGVSPDVDGHDETAQALQRLYPAPTDSPDEERNTIVLDEALALEWQAANLAKVEAERRFKLAQNRIRDALMGARYGDDQAGRRLVERQVYKRSEYTVAAGQVDRLLYKGPKYQP